MELLLLDEKPRSTDWVPLATYERLFELLCELEGGGSSDYVQGCGRASARRFLDSSNFQQVENLKERYAPSDLKEARSGLRPVLTMISCLINRGHWTIESDPDRRDSLAVQITDARDYPDVLLHAITGFVAQMGLTVDEDAHWFFERADADVVLLRTNDAFPDEVSSPGSA